MAEPAHPSLWGGIPLRTIDETELLRRILPGMPRGRGLLVPPGDDAAVFTSGPRTIATTDTMVLGRDWLDEWSSGADVGHKVIAQNLADVAAMGGRATGVLLTLVVPGDANLDWVLDHATGLQEACAAAGVAVLGGDLSSAPSGVAMVSVTALGILSEGQLPVLRSGARVGDVVAVSGTLGLAAAGLVLLEEGRAGALPEAVERQRRPTPPLDQGPLAAAAGAHAMIDLSDGLMRDAGRIAAASGVALDLDSAALSADVDRLVPALAEEQAWHAVLAGGEEHSLLATFDGEPPAGWRVIGAVRELGQGQQPSALLGGRPSSELGWDHFGPT